MHKQVIQFYPDSSPNGHNVRKKVFSSLSYQRKGVGDEVDKLKAYFKPARYNRDCIINERILTRNLQLET